MNELCPDSFLHHYSLCSKSQKSLPPALPPCSGSLSYIPRWVPQASNGQKPQRHQEVSRSLIPNQANQDFPVYSPMGFSSYERIDEPHDAAMDPTEPETSLALSPTQNSFTPPPTPLQPPAPLHASPPLCVHFVGRFPALEPILRCFSRARLPARTKCSTMMVQLWEYNYAITWSKASYSSQ